MRDLDENPQHSYMYDLEQENKKLKQRWEDLKGYMKQEAADEGQRGSDYSAYFSHVAKKMEELSKEKEV